jgi:DNA-binding transcriptional LysR family regulator
MAPDSALATVEGWVTQVTAINQAGAVPVPAARSEGLAPPGVELRHLRYFVAVADAGTFTRAAERMFIAQPTLSQQVRRLEEIVGAPLLQRRREGVRLTSAGTVLLEECRAILASFERGVSRTRQVAGLGRARLRVVMPPYLPEALAIAAASRLRTAAAAVGIDLAWLETPLDAEFSLIHQHRADAGLGWLTVRDETLPACVEVMSIGEFEPVVWITSSHPAASSGMIGLDDLVCMDVIHGPRGVSAGTYDAWLTVLRAIRPRFEFADPPFRQSLPMTLAFAATADRPTAVLSNPHHAAGTQIPGPPAQAANAYDMTAVRLEKRPLTATAGLVWSGDLPRPLQQVLFDAADGIAC